MVRKLKFHEEKLLKKVDFINWEVDNNLHEVRVMKKYYIQKREDYTKYICILCITNSLKFNFIYLFQIDRYNKLSREIREIADKIKELDPKDPFRIESSSTLLEKL